MLWVLWAPHEGLEELRALLVYSTAIAGRLAAVAAGSGGQAAWAESDPWRRLRSVCTAALSATQTGCCKCAVQRDV